MKKILCSAVAAIMICSSVSAEIIIEKDYSGAKPVITVTSGGQILSVYDKDDNLVYMNDTVQTGSFEPFAINVSGDIQDFTMYVDMGDVTETAELSVINSQADVDSVCAKILQMGADERQKIFTEFASYIMWSDECEYLYSAMNDEEKENTADAIYALVESGDTKDRMQKKISDWFLTEIIMKSSWADLKKIATEQMKLFEDSSVLSDDYNKLSSTRQSNVFKNTFAQANNISTKADLIRYINQYITDEKDSDAPSGGNSGSSSSGRGGSGVSVSVGGNSVVTKPVEITPPTEKQPEEFSDMEKAQWAQEAVTAMSEKGIIKGYGDGSFKPDNNVTRAEFVAMAVRAFGLSGEDEEVFEDVKKGTWHFGVVAAAYKEGIITGTGGRFMPDNSITREDAAVIISRILEKKGMPEAKEAVEFTDSKEISEYAAEAVDKLAAAGIIGGMPDGSFAPGANLSRAQAAVILHRCMN